MRFLFYSICTFLFSFSAFPAEFKVGPKNQPYTSIQDALQQCAPGDTVTVFPGVYRAGNITIRQPIVFRGINRPTLDGENKHEIISVKASNVLVEGFRIQHSGRATMEDPAGIKVYNGRNVIIRNNELDNTFFGIYIQYGIQCLIQDNVLTAYAVAEQEIGNGIHLWKCDSMQIIHNKIKGHRDGIYFEFVTNSVIWRNISTENIRYGLHFMFSNNDSYITNVFRNNGAGVAVMFTHGVKMYNNLFEENWGDAAYGLLLKEISDSYVSGNRFSRNTTGIFMEGANRILMEKNVFEQNGWALKIQASCMDNTLLHNNFISNTFDVGTNGSLVLNIFNSNYWDKYEGYDLNKDKVGDIPFRPVSLFSMIIEKIPPAMMLFRSFMTTLLDKTEKLIPSITPENLKDETPLMKPLPL